MRHDTIIEKIKQIFINNGNQYMCYGQICERLIGMVNPGSVERILRMNRELFEEEKEKGKYKKFRLIT